jgi:Flp pilus assembly protein TadD
MTDTGGPHHVVWQEDSKPEVDEARQLLRRGDADGAIAILEPLTMEESDDYMLFELLGVAYAHTNNLDASVGAFQTAVHLNPAKPQTHYNLGMAMLRAGDAVGGHDALAQALRVDPTYGKAREALGSLEKRTAAAAPASESPTGGPPSAPSFGH